VSGHESSVARRLDHESHVESRGSIEGRLIVRPTTSGLYGRRASGRVILLLSDGDSYAG
jgi:hypothetical protein